MKKIMSLIIAFAMISTLLTTAVSANSIKMDTDDRIALLQKLDVLAEDVPELDSSVTRGEFITYLARLLKINTSSHIDTRYYIDISEDSELWDVSANLVNYVLTVPADRKLRPDDTIQYQEAACALMKAYGAGELKYELYTQLAQEQDLLDGVSHGNLRYKDVVNLLYNAFIGYPWTYKDKGKGPGNRTFMEIYHDMYFVRGVVNAVNESALDGNRTGRTESIRVGDITVESDLEDSYAYLGREVGVFYTSEDNPQLFYIFSYEDKEDIVTITERDKPDFDASSFTLSYNDENGRVKKLRLPQNVNVVYNNQNMTSNVKGAFDLFNAGKITVLSTKADNDNVIIESYYDISVMSVSVSEQIVYGKDGSIISLDSHSGPIYIKDTGGNDIELGAIEKDSIVSVFESDVYLKLIVSNTTVSGTISSVKNGDFVTLSVGNSQYDVMPDRDLVYAAGDYVVLYLNYAGYISNISAERKDGMKYGWITKCYVPTDPEEDGVYITVFNEDGDYSRFLLAKKTTIDGVMRKTPDLQAFGLEQGKRGMTDQMILYKTNDEGQVKEIDTIFPNLSSGGIAKEFSNAEGTYGSASVGKLIWASPSTKVFVIPSAENRENQDAYAIGTRNLLEAWGTNDVDSYRSSKLDKPAAAEVIVLRRDMYSYAKEQKGAFVVDETYIQWNKDNQEVDNIVTLISGSSKKEYVIAKNFTRQNDLVKGNIVTIGLNGKNELSTVTLQYGVDTNGNEVKIPREIGAWGDSTHYVAIGEVVAIGDEYADLSITGDNKPTVRFPLGTTNIGVFDRNAGNGFKVGSTADIAEAMMCGDVVALSMYRGTVLSIAIVKE